MAKQGFAFKQFSIDHSACAMKVGTDSIMLGSWVQAGNAKRILDIGTGSGLLAIMLAQKAKPPCEIIGIDIDEDAVQQAKGNVTGCPWPELIDIKQVALEDYESRLKFDLIISNPPYFPINHSANQTARNAGRAARVTARQTVTLDHSSLLKNVFPLLAENGRFCCVLPAAVSQQFIRQAREVGLYCQHILEVKALDKGKTIRCLLAFSLTHQTPSQDSLSIYNQRQEYSEQYRKLCQDYYLNF